MSRLPTRRDVRRRGWSSLAKLGIGAGLLAVGMQMDGWVAFLIGAVAGYFASAGAAGLVLAALHTYTLAIYRRPWS